MILDDIENSWMVMSTTPQKFRMVIYITVYLLKGAVKEFLGFKATFW